MNRLEISELEKRGLRRILNDMSTKDIRSFWNELSPNLIESLHQEILNDPVYASDLYIQTVKFWLEGRRTTDEHETHYGYEAGQFPKS